MNEIADFTRDGRKSAETLLPPFNNTNVVTLNTTKNNTNVVQQQVN